MTFRHDDTGALCSGLRSGLRCTRCGWFSCMRDPYYRLMAEAGEGDDHEKLERCVARYEAEVAACRSRGPYTELERARRQLYGEL